MLGNNSVHGWRKERVLRILYDPTNSMSTAKHGGGSIVILRDARISPAKKLSLGIKWAFQQDTSQDVHSGYLEKTMQDVSNRLT